MEETEFKVYDQWTKTLFFCGMDVHKHEIAVAICSAMPYSSKIIKTAIFSADTLGLERIWNFVKKFKPRGFAMEATGVYHHVPFEFLRAKQQNANWHYSIMVVNPSDAAGLPGREKNDRIDAQHLATYLSKGLLKNGKPIIRVLEDLKAIFRTANRIERDRTALKNRIKKILDMAGIRPRKFNIDTLWGCNFLYHLVNHEGNLGSFIGDALSEGHPLEKHQSVIRKNLELFVPYFEYSLNFAQKALIRHYLVEYDFKSSSKTLLSVEVDQLLVDYPSLRRSAHNLSTLPGISPFTAVWILAEIGNVKQFPNKRKFASYCGCYPRIVSSAGKVYSAHVNRHSNKYLRTIFYRAATVLTFFTKKRSALKDYAERILGRKRGKTKKYPLSVIAAKINAIAYAILRDDVPFYPEIIQEQMLRQDLEDNDDFSITDKRIIKNARNSLKRMMKIESSGKLGLLYEDAQKLAEEFDLVLQGKN